MTALAPLAPPTLAQRDALRATMLHARRAFPLYRERMDARGLTEQHIAGDPLGALLRLPLLTVNDLHRLSAEALTCVGGALAGIEPTSGTTGPPKRRVLSELDVRCDAVAVTRLMRLAGVRPADRVVAIDLSAEPLTVAFLEGCERLGVRDSVAVALTRRLDAGPLLRLDPTVLISPPNLLARLARALTAAGAAPSLRMVVYNGDRLGERAATAYRARGVGLRSLYGLTETSALGIECPSESGIHLATEHALAELALTDGEERGTPRERAPRELVVTTPGYAMPLLRYPTGDLVRPVPGPCPCGSPWPRVHVVGRLGDRFSLFDVKLSHAELADLVLESPEERLQIVLDQLPDGRERMTLRLTASARARRAAIAMRLHSHPTLDYLLTAGLVQVRFSYWEPDALARKAIAVIDRRGREG